jgi:hypothetical protein
LRRAPWAGATAKPRRAVICPRWWHEERRWPECVGPAAAGTGANRRGARGTSHGGAAAARPALSRASERDFNADRLDRDAGRREPIEDSKVLA